MKSTTAGPDRPAQQDPEDSAFLKRLGQRVRRFRGQRGLSRKLLAQSAGVSERYLAQLESGQGNISILRLRHLAAALDRRLEEIISDGQLAGPATQRPVRRIALIGLRGAGKSTLGRQAAAALGMPFIELNDEISRVSGLSVPEIFNLYGPEGYRRLERRCLRQVVEDQNEAVLASGGGLVEDSATYDLLRANFFTVWLRAAPDEHMARVRAQGDLRPMADNPEAMADLKLILRSREALYSRADRELDTTGRPAAACLADLIGLIEAQQAPSDGSEI